MRLIVTGTGRSGTGYLAKMLTNAGLVCGHEQVFGPDGEGPNALGFPADSSWMAVPYLSHWPLCPVVLVHRHPLAVISSFVGIKFFEVDTPYRRFLYAKNPTLRNLSPFEATCQHYIDWNRRALEYASVVTDLDDIAWGRIARLAPPLTVTDLAGALPTVSQTYNHRERANVDPDAVPHEVWEMRAELMEASE